MKKVRLFIASLTVDETFLIGFCTGLVSCVVLIEVVAISLGIPLNP